MTHISRRNERINDANEHHRSKWNVFQQRKSPLSETHKKKP